MKKILVLGSTVTDVIIRINKLPRTAEDVDVKEHTLSLGGCAYNVSDTLRCCGVPYTLFSPIGSGFYGDFVRKGLARMGIVTDSPSPEGENGCCYCFIEDTGERTFVCNRGVEYHFRKEWLEGIDTSQTGSVYICGLELQEEDNECMIDFLESHRELRVYFAPGPHINGIPKGFMERMMALSPVLHLNEDEALRYTGEPTYEKAASALHSATGQPVIVTLDKRGAYYKDNTDRGVCEAIPCTQADTIGAGDAHMGAVIAHLEGGKSLREAVALANEAAARVVMSKGGQAACS